MIIVDETTGERIVLWDRDEQAAAARRVRSPIDALGATRLLHVDDVDQDAAIEAASIGREAGVLVTSDIDRLTDADRGTGRGGDAFRSSPSTCRRR